GEFSMIEGSRWFMNEIGGGYCCDDVAVDGG
ncbi:hypothetical protein A2U01_0059537, partial [Trifolium medium]|nr:hypothetical protein [Trifolium medium]